MATLGGGWGGGGDAKGNNAAKLSPTSVRSPKSLQGRGGGDTRLNSKAAESINIYGWYQLLTKRIPQNGNFGGEF